MDDGELCTTGEATTLKSVLNSIFRARSDAPVGGCVHVQAGVVVGPLVGPLDGRGWAARNPAETAKLRTWAYKLEKHICTDYRMDSEMLVQKSRGD